MDKLYIETKSNLLQINDLLGQFESTHHKDDSEPVKSKINEKFKQINNFCDQLDIYVAKEPASRRYDAKLKVDQLKYDFQHYKTAFNNIQYKKY